MMQIEELINFLRCHTKKAGVRLSGAAMQIREHSNLLVSEYQLLKLVPFQNSLNGLFFR